MIEAMGLNKRNIAAATDAVKAYSSPRRLAVLVPRVAKMQADAIEEIWGPPVSVGRDCSAQ